MNPKLQRVRRDVIAVVLLAVGLFLSVALLTYHPSDFSWNSLPRGNVVQNACGVVGSFLADVFLQSFGVSSWLMVGLIFLTAGRALRGLGTSIGKGKLVWSLLGILWLSAAVSTFLPHWTFAGKTLPGGGALGVLMSRLMVKAVNPVGLKILLASAGVLWVLFFFERTFAEILSGPSRLFAAVGEALRRIAKRIPWSSFVEFVFEGDVSRPGRSGKTETLKIVPLDAEGGRAAVEEHPSQEHKSQLLESVVKVFKSKASAPEKTKEPEEKTNTPEKRRKIQAAKPRSVENWQLPSLNLIENPPLMRIRIEEKEIQRKADLLKEKLSHFSVRGEVVAARPGPAVTLFEFRPEADVKLSKITDLEDDLSLALSSESLRILAPIPGRDVVGVETSNSQREMVFLKDLLAEKSFWKEEIKLPICLGKQVNGEPRITDLRKMPHLMVAGTTGSGKSVFTVSAIISMIFKHSPKTLRLLLIDPKQVDLTPFENIPHLVAPIVTDSRQAVVSLKWAVREMEKRYRSMSEFSARGLEDYNTNVEKLTKEDIQTHLLKNQELEQVPGKKGEMYYCHPLPYLVIIVEEFADLMTVDKANVETSVVRLAQKARACGIHLILCLQSPRREVVTGLIKSNIPGRIAFKAASVLESRLILDESGAERLLAQGDMLFRSPGSSAVIRHHGPYLKDSDIAAVTGFWSDQAAPQFEFNPEEVENSAGGADSGNFGGGDEESFDDKYDEILSWASAQKEISASLIQRRFQLGYPRAARMIETFEKQGVVGPANGSKPRQVLVNNLKEL